MKKPAYRFPVKPLTLAVLASVSVGTLPAFAQEAEDEEVIEEVVATGTRLKGTATAVMEERKNQAFVADIMGAEQISRTGDSDAASALRRVTGLTLVDGKFIYVRGLGERYSSTQLNGLAVPSPDPTRNVIPLDLFPATIIESLSVQKAYSPSMPASFGGGNVDIRLKSIPTEFVLNVQGQLGSNSNNFDDAYQYGSHTDWLGQDDGFRAAPADITERWANKNFLDGLSQEEAVDLFSQMSRDYDPRLESVDPDYKANLSLGNSFDYDDDWRFGFLLASGYDKSTNVSEEYIGQQPLRNGDEIRMVRFFDEVNTTEKSLKWSTMLNLGVDYNRQHRIDYSLAVLSDTRDQIQDRVGNTANITLSDNQRIRQYEVIFEERKLYTNQLRGTHTFPELGFLGFDWKYSLGRSLRDAPGNMEARFLLDDENLDGVYDRFTESSLSNSPTAGRYSYQNLHDRVENWAYNFNFPYMIDKWEMEFKAGGNFITKTRTAENRRLDVDSRIFADSSMRDGYLFGEILSDDVLFNSELNPINPVLRDTTVAGDDYAAGQKVDAYYFEADLFWNNLWRFSGGVRYEDFRQAVVPFDPRTNQFDIPDDADRSQLTFQEDAFYPSLAVTYFLEENMQLRFSFGKTVVRPDLREVSASTYIDPLTDFPIGGTPGIRTTSINNFDARWEWYRENGNNLSVGLFYKDMSDPIESVQSPAQDGPPLVRIANAESGELYGVEVEFLQGLEFIGEGIWDNMFLSGNVTLSDSEIQLDRQNIVDQTGVSASVTNLERRLTGHSKWVVNTQLGFDSDNGEHSASLVYNVFGPRILIPGIDGFDDSFEQPFHSLDVVYKWYPDFNTTVTLKVQNMLDQEKKIEFEDTLLRSETRGTSFSLAYRYDF